MSGMVLTAGERLATPMRNSCGTNSSGHHCMSGIVLTAGGRVVIPMWYSLERILQGITVLGLAWY